MTENDTITCYTTGGQAVVVPRAEVRLRAAVYGIAFTADRGQVLLVRDRQSRVWELPGGAPAPGEPAAASLERAFREEVGLDVRVGAALYFAEAFEYLDAAPPAARQALKLFYLIQTAGPLDPHYAENRESAGTTYGAAWVPGEELEAIDLPADHYDAVQRAMHWLDATEGPVAADDDDDE